MAYITSSSNIYHFFNNKQGQVKTLVRYLYIWVPRRDNIIMRADIKMIMDLLPSYIWLQVKSDIYKCLWFTHKMLFMLVVLLAVLVLVLVVSMAVVGIGIGPVICSPAGQEVLCL